MNYCTLLPHNSVSMCCTAASPGTEGALAMSCAGGFVIYLFIYLFMGVVYFECTLTCFTLTSHKTSPPQACTPQTKQVTSTQSLIGRRVPFTNGCFVLDHHHAHNDATTLTIITTTPPKNPHSNLRSTSSPQS